MGVVVHLRFSTRVQESDQGPSGGLGIGLVLRTAMLRSFTDKILEAVGHPCSGALALQQTWCGSLRELPHRSLISKGGLGHVSTPWRSLEVQQEWTFLERDQGVQGVRQAVVVLWAPGQVPIPRRREGSGAW